MILIAPGTILAMTPESDLLGGPTKENARTPLSPDGSNGPYKDPKNHAPINHQDDYVESLYMDQMVVKMYAIFYVTNDPM